MIRKVAVGLFLVGVMFTTTSCVMFPSSNPNYPLEVEEAVSEDFDAFTLSGEPQSFVDGTEVLVVTYGSSSCPATFSGARASIGYTLDLIETEPVPDKACTADFAPSFHKVDVGEKIDNIKFVRFNSFDEKEKTVIPVIKK